MIYESSSNLLRALGETFDTVSEILNEWNLQFKSIYLFYFMPKLLKLKIFILVLEQFNSWKPLISSAGQIFRCNWKHTNLFLFPETHNEGEVRSKDRTHRTEEGSRWAHQRIIVMPEGEVGGGKEILIIHYISCEF